MKKIILSMLILMCMLGALCLGCTRTPPVTPDLPADGETIKEKYNEVAALLKFDSDRGKLDLTIAYKNNDHNPVSNTLQIEFLIEKENLILSVKGPKLEQPLLMDSEYVYYVNNGKKLKSRLTPEGSIGNIIGLPIDWDSVKKMSIDETWFKDIVLENGRYTLTFSAVGVEKLLKIFGIEMNDTVVMEVEASVCSRSEKNIELILQMNGKKIGNPTITTENSITICLDSAFVPEFPDLSLYILEEENYSMLLDTINTSTRLLGQSDNVTITATNDKAAQAFTYDQSGDSAQFNYNRGDAIETTTYKAGKGYYKSWGAADCFYYQNTTELDFREKSFAHNSFFPFNIAHDFQFDFEYIDDINFAETEQISSITILLGQKGYPYYVEKLKHVDLSVINSPISMEYIVDKTTKLPRQIICRYSNWGEQNSCVYTFTYGLATDKIILPDLTKYMQDVSDFDNITQLPNLVRNKGCLEKIEYDIYDNVYNVCAYVLSQGSEATSYNSIYQYDQKANKYSTIPFAKDCRYIGYDKDNIYAYALVDGEDLAGLHSVLFIYNKKTKCITQCEVPDFFGHAKVFIVGESLFYFALDGVGATYGSNFYAYNLHTKVNTMVIAGLNESNTRLQIYRDIHTILLGNLESQLLYSCDTLSLESQTLLNDYTWDGVRFTSQGYSYNGELYDIRTHLKTSIPELPKRIYYRDPDHNEQCELVYMIGLDDNFAYCNNLIYNLKTQSVEMFFGSNTVYKIENSILYYLPYDYRYQAQGEHYIYVVPKV